MDHPAHSPDPRSDPPGPDGPQVRPPPSVLSYSSPAIEKPHPKSVGQLVTSILYMLFGLFLAGFGLLMLVPAFFVRPISGGGILFGGAMLAAGSAFVVTEARGMRN